MSTSRLCDSYLPAAGVEYYYYDQLGSGNSEHPDDMDLWQLDRFVDELEQVRRALGLGRDNFVLYGQSWGGASSPLSTPSATNSTSGAWSSPT